MFAFDLQLDNNGNTEIENGDFKMTTDDRQFIVQMLMTSPGSWMFHEGLGTGLVDFIGMQANDETIREIRTRINSVFKNFGLYPEMLLYYVNDSTLSMSLSFNILGIFDVIVIYLFFDVTSGTITFTDVSPSVQTVQNTMVTNKYLNRRG